MLLGALIVVGVLAPWVARDLNGYMRMFLEPWRRLTVTALHISEVGDTVVAEVSQQGEGRLSGASTGFLYFQLWTFRGEVVVRLENIMTREEALAAVRR